MIVILFMQYENVHIMTAAVIFGSFSYISLRILRLIFVLFFDM